MMKTVLRLLRENGAVLLRQKKHCIYKLSNGQIWVTPRTASDWRSWRNNLAGLKRVLHFDVGNAMQ
ncbi:MAG TPA: type II toxin-antitoxin system HicA family toxin [Candidatus Acidoferrum sp.]|nr:type II toxin-antitoxin system HicA family toxin [Candidatus Acidoferrum sp.]